jgi:hypothetical protein
MVALEDGHSLFLGLFKYADDKDHRRIQADP